MNTYTEWLTTTAKSSDYNIEIGRGLDGVVYKTQPINGFVKKVFTKESYLIEKENIAILQKVLTPTTRLKYTLLLPLNEKLTKPTFNDEEYCIYYRISDYNLQEYVAKSKPQNTRVLASDVYKACFNVLSEMHKVRNKDGIYLYHGDIKLQNLMVFSKGGIGVIDFNCMPGHKITCGTHMFHHDFFMHIQEQFEDRKDKSQTEVVFFQEYLFTKNLCKKTDLIYTQAKRIYDSNVPTKALKTSNILYNQFEVSNNTNDYNRDINSYNDKFALALVLLLICDQLDLDDTKSQQRIRIDNLLQNKWTTITSVLPSVQSVPPRPQMTNPPQGKPFTLPQIVKRGGDSIYRRLCMKYSKMTN